MVDLCLNPLKVSVRSQLRSQIHVWVSPEHMQLLGGALFEELVFLSQLCLPESRGELFSTPLSVTREVSPQIPLCCLCCSAALGIPSPPPMLQRLWNPAQSPAVFLPLSQQPQGTHPW